MSTSNNDDSVQYPKSPIPNEIARYWFIIGLLAIVVIIALLTTVLSLLGANIQQLAPLSGMSASLNGIVIGMLVSQGKVNGN